MKVLKLDHWMLEYARGEQGLLTHPIHIARYENEKPYFNKSYPYLTDIPLKDGWYCDEHCFFVVNGKAYRGDKEMFKYTLDKLCSLEEVGSPDLVESLYLLERKVFGSATEKTSRLYRAVCLHRDSLRIKKSFVSLRKRLRDSRKLNKELTILKTNTI